MSKIADKAYELAQDVASSLGLELAHVEYIKEGNVKILRFYIDKEGGIDTADCENFSKAISPMLDKEDMILDKYYLEVSSPGICPTIRKTSDYKKYKGRQAEVALYTAYEGKKKFTAEILGLSEDEKEVLFKVNNEEFTIPLDKISKAKLTYEF
jgi:ribosome maturation factor RimP